MPNPLPSVLTSTPGAVRATWPTSFAGLATYRCRFASLRDSPLNEGSWGLQRTLTPGRALSLSDTPVPAKTSNPTLQAARGNSSRATDVGILGASAARSAILVGAYGRSRPMGRDPASAFTFKVSIGLQASLVALRSLPGRHSIHRLMMTDAPVAAMEDKRKKGQGAMRPMLLLVDVSSVNVALGPTCAWTDCLVS
jgi:hypothetical protein